MKVRDSYMRNMKKEIYEYRLDSESGNNGPACVRRRVMLYVGGDNLFLGKLLDYHNHMSFRQCQQSPYELRSASSQKSR